MILIWSRGGILTLVFAGVGVGLGFLLKPLLGLSAAGGPVNGVFAGIGLLLGAVGLYFFDLHVVQRRRDRPRPLMLTEQLAEPTPGPDGTLQRVRQVPAVHPQTGQPIVRQPRSTFFFIPMRFWPFILGGIGALVVVTNLIGVANA